MKIALLGDIALFGRMSVNENPNVAAYFSEIADYLKGFDYVVGNLETPFSVEKKTNGAKSAYICSDVENVKTLKHLHINAVCLANNHMFDFGKEGYETTKRILTDNGIEYFGAEGKEVKLIDKNNKLVFSGFCCYTTNPLQCVPYGEYGVNAYNLLTAERILKINSENGYFNIMSVHAGLEHVNYPAIEHIRAARNLADVKPFVYYGHHPHVIQGVEEYKGSLIAHSLGNFCFDDVYTDNSRKPLVVLTEANRTGIILELNVINGKLKDWRELIFKFPKEGRMYLTSSSDDINDYNEKLKNCEKDVDRYTATRNNIITKRLSERKAKRDLKWYLKRFRLRYALMILNGKRNARLFEMNIKTYLNS